MSIEAFNWVLNDAPNVKAGAEFSVLAALSNFVQVGEKTAWASADTLARQTRYTENNVRKTLAVLVQKRLIKKVGTHGRNRISIYELAMEPPGTLSNGIGRDLSNGIGQEGSDQQDQPESPYPIGVPTLSNRIGAPYPIGAPTLSNGIDKRVLEGNEREGEGAQGVPESSTSAFPPLTPSHFENSLDQNPIPQEWLNDYSGMEYCHDRHPDGNKYNDPCQGCRQMKQRIKTLREKSERQNAEQQRLREEQRRNGKDKCNICDRNGRRELIRHNTGQPGETDCYHGDIDRHEHIAALEFEGKHDEAQRVSGLTAVQAS